MNTSDITRVRTGAITCRFFFRLTEVTMARDEVAFPEAGATTQAVQDPSRAGISFAAPSSRRLNRGGK